MKYFWGFIALVLALFSLITLNLSIFTPFQHFMFKFPFVNLMSFRVAVALVLFTMGIFIFILSFIRLVKRGRALISGLLAVILLVVSLLHGGIILTRGITNTEKLPLDYGVSMMEKGDGTLTVLSYNTQGGQTTVMQLADVIIKNGVDIVVLPETSTARGNKLRLLLQEKGLNFQFFNTDTPDTAPEFSSTILLVSSGLGKYTQEDLVAGNNTTLSGVKAVSVAGDMPDIIAVHPMAPIPEFISRWKQEITTVYNQCVENSNFIMAGDFNSTVDHQNALGITCIDAGQEAKIAGLGTWPATTSPYLATPIDRVLHDGNHYTGSKGKLVKIGNSDHRGILLRLSPNTNF